MAKQRTKKKTHDELYNEKYGHIPDDHEARVNLLLNTRIREKVQRNVDTTIGDLKHIKMHKLRITWYTEPHPSKRPRATFRNGFAHIYVPMAAETRENFGEFIRREYPSIKPVNTPMTYSVTSYLPTPSSMPRSHKVLAELGVLRPWGMNADSDNLFKTYSDCALGTLIADDCLAHDIESKKFYSIKPRVEIEITYYSRWPKGILPIEPKRRSEMKCMEETSKKLSVKSAPLLQLGELDLTH